jgi:glutamate racemase
MSNQAIGIFDSGIGGLTVQRAVTELLPEESTIYLGDTARVPYGTKSPETVTAYALEIADYLLKKDIKLLIVACNTASAFALSTLKEKLNIPVIGVIEPGAKAAVETSHTRRIGVIGTEGTIRSGAYFDAIKAIDPRAVVYMNPCPLFVPLAEEGWTNNDVATLAAARYLEEFQNLGVDSIVLGCTHYPLLKKTIETVMGQDVSLIDSGLATATEVKALLKDNDLSNTSGKVATHTFFVTDSPERFERVGANFFNGEVTANRISLNTHSTEE